LLAGLLPRIAKSYYLSGHIRGVISTDIHTGQRFILPAPAWIPVT
jgi:hypothetical protein